MPEVIVEKNALSSFSLREKVRMRGLNYEVKMYLSPHPILLP
jgi:hypothetical protein